MNKAFVLLLTSVAIATVSCKKEKGETEHIVIEQRTDWTTTPFKSDYTIQFPTDYTGDGMVGFEGNTFWKKAPNDQVFFSYSYCGPLWCDDFGATLATPFPNSVEKKVGNDVIVLDQKTIYTDNGTDIGILYYTNDNEANGKVYWKEAGEFKEAVDIKFKAHKLGEIKEIVKTIKHK